MTDFLWWLVTPSGGPVQPGVLGWLSGVKRRPIVAHPGGGILMGLLFCLAGYPYAAPLGAALGEGVNQFYKAIRGVYGPTTMPFQVFARIFLAVLFAGLTAFWWVS
jgi:hypothetical protein